MMLVDGGGVKRKPLLLGVRVETSKNLFEECPSTPAITSSQCIAPRLPVFARGSVTGTDRHSEPGSFPFREPVLEPGGAVATSAQLSDGVVGVDAVRPSAVGDDVDVVGK